MSIHSIDVETLNDADRAFLLADALQQAVYTVEFLHACLTGEPKHVYAYPSMTLSKLMGWRDLLPDRPEWCVHSKIVSGCESCAWQKKRLERLAQIASSNSQPNA